MKKTITFLMLSLIITGCDSDRNDDFKFSENSDVLNEVQNKAIICKNEPSAPMALYGNLSDYPTILVPTYFSMDKLANSNNNEWFFNELTYGTTAYVNQYYNHCRCRFPWDTGTTQAPADWLDGRPPYDYTFSGSISSSEILGGFQPDTMISAETATYIQYRILSKIDSDVAHVQHYYAKNIKPKGIVYNYDRTMCGTYTGLYITIFYRISN